jgi:hypothetical protein
MVKGIVRLWRRLWAAGHMWERRVRTMCGPHLLAVCVQTAVTGRPDGCHFRQTWSCTDEVIYLHQLFRRSRVSSGSIVSDYGLDDRAIGIRSPAGEKDFSSSLCVQTGSGSHPASCTMGTGGPFPGGKARPGRDADHSPPSSAEVENE